MRRLLKRWWFCLGTLALLGIVLAGYLLLPASASQISQANCDKIQLGWTPEQVIELLGPHDVPFKPRGAAFRAWGDEDDNAIIVVFLDRRVTGREFEPTDRAFLELMKSRIMRRIRALWP
jgi:hypothetical protein